MSLKTEFEDAVGRRSATETRFRECAAFTIPSILPPLAHIPGKDILRPYQSLGADGLKNLVNKIVIALFPPGGLWFKHEISPKLRNDPTVTQEIIEQLDAFLYIRDLSILGQFNNMRYRGKIRTQVENLLAIGNSLAKLTDEYRIKVFRFDQWVQKRGSDATLLWTITKECEHPSQLTQEDINKAGLTPDELKDEKKTIDIYTKSARQSDGKWFIQQEIKDKIIRDSYEPVNPYFAPGYVEMPGEDYSRGFVEEILGDLRSFNGLSKAILEGSLAAATVYFCFDPAKGWVKADLEKPNLSVLIGRVNGNVPDGVGVIRIDKNADFTVAMTQATTIEKRLNKGFLLETPLQPRGERVTATQVMRIHEELEGALGGIYIELADEIQRPLVERLIYQMERDVMLRVLPPQLKKEVNLHILTGLAALGRESELQRAGSALHILGPIPGMIDKFKPRWILDTVLQGLQVDPRDALKSEEEMEAEKKAVEQAETKRLLQEQAIKSGGKVVEEAAKPETVASR